MKAGLRKNLFLITLGITVAGLAAWQLLQKLYPIFAGKKPESISQESEKSHCSYLADADSCLLDQSQKGKGKDFFVGSGGFFY